MFNIYFIILLLHFQIVAVAHSASVEVAVKEIVVVYVIAVAVLERVTASVGTSASVTNPAVNFRKLKQHDWIEL